MVGTPRSGTTLAQQALFSLAEVDSHFETHFFSNLNYRNFLRSRFYSKEVICRDVLCRLSPRDDFKVNMRDLPGAFFDVVRDRLDSLGKFIFVEKTPAHLAHIRSIEKACPVDFDLVFLHVIRSRYENVRSLYFAANEYPGHWGGKRSLACCVRRWSHDLRLHYNFLPRRGVHTFVSYEEFVSNYRSYLEKICKKLDLECSITIPTRNLKNIISENEDWKGKNFEEVGQGRVYDFMSPVEFERQFRFSSSDRRMYMNVVEGCL
ncbi:sulfotransferase family protein [Microbulbifer celer]|uniref:sulfotransferase family protein n=1 Tax=Microbulbifer celer TaxID=435905 RepID=UPI0038B31250